MVQKTEEQPAEAAQRLIGAVSLLATFGFLVLFSSVMIMVFATWLGSHPLPAVTDPDFISSNVILPLSIFFSFWFMGSFCICLIPLGAFWSARPNQPTTANQQTPKDE